MTLVNGFQITPYYSITTELAKLIVTSLILPRLDYCNYTLNSLPAHTIKMLTILQYRAIRTIFRIKKILKTTYHTLYESHSLATHPLQHTIQITPTDPPCHP